MVGPGPAMVLSWGVADCPSRESVTKRKRDGQCGESGGSVTSPRNERFLPRGLKKPRCEASACQRRSFPRSCPARWRWRKPRERHSPMLSCRRSCPPISATAQQGRPLTNRDAEILSVITRWSRMGSTNGDGEHLGKVEGYPTRWLKRGASVRRQRTPAPLQHGDGGAGKGRRWGS